MIWLTSLPTAVLVVGGLAAALLVAIGGRLAARALVPAAEREGAHSVAAPLMPALGAAFALFTALTLASEAGFLASAQGIVSSEAADASRLAWAATSPGVDPAPIQSALLGYQQVTRTYEWHGKSAAAGDDPAVHRARHKGPPRPWPRVRGHLVPRLGLRTRGPSDRLRGGARRRRGAPAPVVGPAVGTAAGPGTPAHLAAEAAKGWWATRGRKGGQKGAGSRLTQVRQSILDPFSPPRPS